MLLTRLRPGKGSAVFNRFAHSAGPGLVVEGVLAAGCCTGGRRAGGQGDMGAGEQGGKGAGAREELLPCTQMCAHVCTQKCAYASNCVHKVVCTQMCAQKCVHRKVFIARVFLEGFFGPDSLGVGIF